MVKNLSIDQRGDFLGIEDVLVFCVDGLIGLNEAINAAYPKSEIQG